MFCEAQTGRRGRGRGVDNEKQISIFCLPQIENIGSLAQVKRLSKKQCPASVYLELYKKMRKLSKRVVKQNPFLFLLRNLLK
jgi:hypothetical protein